MLASLCRIFCAVFFMRSQPLVRGEELTGQPEFGLTGALRGLVDAFRPRPFGLEPQGLRLALSDRHGLLKARGVNQNRSCGHLLVGVV